MLFFKPNIEKLEFRRDIKQLINALTYKKENVWDRKAASIRMAAAEALGKIGDPEVVQPLVSAALHDSYGVPEKAAKALGDIGDGRALERLISTPDTTEGAQMEAIKGLRKIGDARAVEALIVALRNRGSDVRIAAAEALGKICDARSVEALLESLKDRNENVRIKVVEILKNVPDPRVIATLTQFQEREALKAEQERQMTDDERLAARIEEMTIERMVEVLSSMPKPETIKLIGRVLYNRGGENLMLNVHKSVIPKLLQKALRANDKLLLEYGKQYDMGARRRAEEVSKAEAMENARTIERAWDGIGTWLG